jgi:hypothetical protein
MWIIPRGGESPEHLKDLVVDKMKLSRFHAHVELGTLGKKDRGVKITCVRLKRRKPYCGAHPGPCLNTGRRHSNATFLEGLDWVGFNALLNDLLDAHSVNADVFSYNRETLKGGKYFVRVGRTRRVRYPYDVKDRFAHWTQDRHDLTLYFVDRCGKAPPPIDEALALLDGTPGYPCYTLDEEDKYRAQEAEAA